MNRTLSHSLKRPLVLVAAAALFVACSDTGTLAPNRRPASAAQLAALPGVDTDGAIATMQRVTARYHDLSVAQADSFVLLHECESLPGEGPVGIVYANFGRVLDGKIDPAAPEGLIYEPGPDGRPQLVGVEFAIPFPLWTQPEPPTFLGATFHNEDDIGVFALHAWIWKYNPEGLFAESNSRVSCGEAD